MAKPARSGAVLERSWRRRLLTVVGVVGAMCAAGAPSTAWAGKPIMGARYVFSGKVPGAQQGSVTLTVANDGLEFAAPSDVGIVLECPDSLLSDGYGLDGRIWVGSRSAQIAPDGTFAYRSPRFLNSRDRMFITGHFERRGRQAVGTVRFREQAPCPDVRFGFRARMVARPLAPHPGRWTLCDPVLSHYLQLPSEGSPYPDHGDELYWVHEKDAGCTTARETARRWYASTACLTLALGRSCATRSAKCTKVRGGVVDPLASVECTLLRRPASQVELVHVAPCPPPPGAYGVHSPDAWAINTGCEAATGFPLDALFPDEMGHGPCGNVYFETRFTCASISSYTRHGTVGESGPRFRVIATCVDEADRSAAIRFEVHV
jgi:hypothetical protein